MKSNNEFLKLYGLITRALDTSINLRTNINSQVITWFRQVYNIDIEGAQVVTETLWGTLCQIVMISPDQYPENFSAGDSLSDIVLIDGDPVNVIIISSEVFNATDKEIFSMIYHIIAVFALPIVNKLSAQLPVSENAMNIIAVMVPVIALRIMRDFRCEYEIEWTTDKELSLNAGGKEKDEKFDSIFHMIVENAVNSNYSIEQLSQGYINNIVDNFDID